MVPTYFRRELRDRVLQRHLRLRTFVSLFSPIIAQVCPTRLVIPRESGATQYAAASRLCRWRSRILDHPLSRVMTAKHNAARPDRMSVIPVTPSKAELRIAALAARDALSSEQRATAAQAVAARGLPIEFARGAVVSGYSPIRGEIDPFPLLRKLAAQGATLALPAVMARGRSLAFRAFSPDDRLLLGPLGILEPSPAAAELIPDIMLVPLAAFDPEGHRIGYGAGHYDYTLAHLRKMKAIVAIGIGFSVQQIKAVPALPHDVALDYVLTEKKVFD